MDRSKKINLHAYRIFRLKLESGMSVDNLVDMAQALNAGTLNMRFALKRKPWVVTIKVARKTR